MGEIVVTEFVSLDGVFEAPGGGDYKHAGWTFEIRRGDEGDHFKLQELREAEVQLLGRVTYEGFAEAWPKMAAGEFGEKMNAMPKYVVSSTLQSADWRNSTILNGDLVTDIAKLKTDVAGQILVAGSGTLVRALLAQGLVDELRLMVFPVVLGSGMRLFGDADDTVALRLTASQTVGDGVLILTYRKP